LRTDDDDDDDRAGGVGKSSRGKKQRGDKQWVIGVIFGMVLAIVLIFYVVTKGCGKGDHARIGLGGGGRGGNDGDNANANANDDGRALDRGRRSTVLDVLDEEEFDLRSVRGSRSSVRGGAGGGGGGWGVQPVVAGQHRFCNTLDTTDAGGSVHADEDAAGLARVGKKRSPDRRRGDGDVHSIPESPHLTSKPGRLLSPRHDAAPVPPPRTVQSGMGQLRAADSSEMLPPVPVQNTLPPFVTLTVGGGGRIIQGNPRALARTTGNALTALGSPVEPYGMASGIMHHTSLGTAVPSTLPPLRFLPPGTHALKTPAPMLVNADVDM
jgi:hypothetical protein